jgi:hypothetical protein
MLLLYNMPRHHYTPRTHPHLSYGPPSPPLYDGVIKCLTVLLFHNDEDLIEDQIDYYGNINKNDLIVFNHNSSDQTSELIEKNKDKIKCIYTLSDKIIFNENEVHQTIYKILLGQTNYNINEVHLSDNKFKNVIYSKIYHWISFPESDEFLEGPNRKLSYYEHLCNLYYNKNINNISFSNIIYWFTEKDDPTIKSPIERIKYYSYKKNCAIRVYAWRGHSTIIRPYGHHNINETYEDFTCWKTRHYEFRSKDHLNRKILDRILPNIQMTHYNILYSKLKKNPDFGIINSSELHYDDRVSEINMTEIYNWNENFY